MPEPDFVLSRRWGTFRLSPSGRFSGLILPAGLKQPIWGLGEAEFPKRRAAGFTLLAGWCLTSNFRVGGCR